MSQLGDNNTSTEMDNKYFDPNVASSQEIISQAHTTENNKEEHKQALNKNS